MPGSGGARRHGSPGAEARGRGARRQESPEAREPGCDQTAPRRVGVPVGTTARGTGARRHSRRGRPGGSGARGHGSPAAEPRSRSPEARKPEHKGARGTLTAPHCGGASAGMVSGGIGAWRHGCPEAKVQGKGALGRPDGAAARRGAIAARWCAVARGLPRRRSGTLSRRCTVGLATVPPWR
jgi:hypothetical protein